MNDQEWAERLRAGVGGPRLWALRKVTAAETAIDFIAVGQMMPRPLVDENTSDETDAIGFLLQMAGELLFASGRLLAGGEHYAGAALLRQMSEIEYLTWTIKERYRTATNWLRSTHAERMKAFTPAQLRKTSKGRFLDKDYQDHCEQGGHPTSRGIPLLGGENVGMAQLLLVDLLTHSWRTWDQVAAWSQEFPRAAKAVAVRHHQISWRLNDWGKEDGIYLAMVERYPDKTGNKVTELPQV
jgi:hypothetical protein